MLKNILIATDLQEKSDEMVDSLSVFIGCSVGQVRLIHVIDERISKRKEIEPYNKDELERQAKIIQKMGFNTETWVTRGIPFDEIIHHAQSWGATLIVVGAGKAPEWVSSWMGSTTLRVLELCPLPVMTTPSVHPGTPSQGEVMMAMDFSDNAFFAFQQLLDLFRNCPTSVTKLTLIHVHKSKNIDLLLKFVDKIHINAIVEIERSRLQKMAQEARDIGIASTEILMKTGKPVDKLLEIIERTQPTMTVLGAQGQGASERYRIGKTAYRLSQLASCRVLTVPFPHKGLPI